MAYLTVAAYGELTPDPDLLDSSAEEDLYSVFVTRSELMCWTDRDSSASSAGGGSVWSMNEAELTYAEAGAEIGWVQVGLGAGTAIEAAGASRPARSEAAGGRVERLEPEYAPTAYPVDSGLSGDAAMAIPPLIQCLDDALRRFGETDVTAFQVTVSDLATLAGGRRSSVARLGGVLNWFNVAGARSGTRAVAAVAADRWDERAAAQVFDFVLRMWSGAFAIGPLVDVPGGYAAQPRWRGIDWLDVDRGLAVSLPEWSPSAVGWVMATLVDAILARDPAPRQLSVRVTRAEAAD